MDTWINLNALWKIVVVGLLTGAGLPAVFALGLRTLSPPGPPGPAAAADRGAAGRAAPERAAAGAAVTAGPLGYAVAGVCFAVVLAAIAWGVYTIAAGS